MAGGGLLFGIYDIGCHSFGPVSIVILFEKHCIYLKAGILHLNIDMQQYFNDIKDKAIPPTA